MRNMFIALMLLVLNIMVVGAAPKNIDSIEHANEKNIVISDPVIKRMDSIKARVDSVKAKIMLVSNNTESKKFLGEDIDWFNFIFAFLAFVVACVSAVFDFRGFRESKRTADNVTRVSLDVQMAQFDDLIRHLYRNLVCTLSFGELTLIRNTHDEYPSEEHLLKLKVLPEDMLHLEKYNDNNNIYKMMHEMKLLLRNYDIEIDTAMMHLKDKRIDFKVLRNDLDTLTFKPLYLIKRIIDITNQMIKLKGGDRDFESFRNTAKIIVKEHVAKLNENEDKLSAHNYKNLNFIDKEYNIDKPYDGLRRALKKFLNLSNEQNILNYMDVFDDDIYFKYIGIIENKCEEIKKLDTFRKSMERKTYDFNEIFLSILSIDVTIESEKIHMINII